MAVRKFNKKKLVNFKTKINDDICSDVKAAVIKIFGDKGLTDEELEELQENNIKDVLELIKTHNERKKALGHRVQVLRVLVRKLHDDKRLKMTEFEFNIRVEKYLDNTLFKYDYRLEKAICALREKCST